VKSSLYPSQELRRKAQHWSVRLRVNPRVIRVQDMRRKWGSCSSKGTLALASDLTEQAPSFQDYVIVHELLHLRVPNHGRLFKALMTVYVPGWRRLDASNRRAGRAVASDKN
jgi:predicted metal-dependent hydrolase